MHAQANDHKSLTRSVVYFLQYAAYAPYQPCSTRFWLLYSARIARPTCAPMCTLVYAAWLLVAFLVLQAPFDYLRAASRRRSLAGLVTTFLRARGRAPRQLDSDSITRYFLASGAVFAGLALALSIYWGTKQEGPMYYYNSWYNFGLYYFAALVAVASSLPQAPPAIIFQRWRSSAIAGAELEGCWPCRRWASSR